MEKTLATIRYTLSASVHEVPRFTQDAPFARNTAFPLPPSHSYFGGTPQTLEESSNTRTKVWNLENTCRLSQCKNFNLS